MWLKNEELCFIFDGLAKSVPEKTYTSETNGLAHPAHPVYIQH